MQNPNELVFSNNSTFSLIYETYKRKMHAYGIAIGFCEYLCHDAAHDIFSTLFTSKIKLEDIENLEIYLMHSMKNRLFDIYKEEKRKHSIDYMDNTTNDYEEEQADKLIAEENRQLMKEQVDRLLNKLPPKHRKIILCRFNYNLKYNEIAVIMKMTPDAVKKQLYRSLKLIEQEAKPHTTRYYNTC